MTAISLRSIAFLSICVAFADEAEEHPCSWHGSFDSEWDDCYCEEGFSGEACESCAAGYVGWPNCAPVAEIVDQSELWGWAHLCPAVKQLRANLPEYIANLGHLYAARQSLSKSGGLQLHEPVGNQVDCADGSHSGPWRLKVDLQAPTQSPIAFRKHHRVLLVFTKDWPASLPTIRFLGKIRSVYTRDSDDRESFGERLHTSEATGLLLRRLQGLTTDATTCMWRQAGDCRSDGPREPEKDELCDVVIPKGASGFCDCDGNGQQNGAEPGYTCSESPGTCANACQSLGLMNMSGKALQSSNAIQRHELSHLLHVIHQSLGGALHAADEKSWLKSANVFAEDASTILKYKAYGRRHPFLYDVGGVSEDAMIDPALRKLLSRVGAVSSRAEARDILLSSGLIQQVVDGLVFSFRVFTPEFCAMVLEEIHHFYGSKLPARRPNSMNNYGIILNEIGLESLVFTMQDRVIQPLAAILLPEAGSEIETHHSFTIRYRGGEDTHLDVHTDDSDITFNVNIFGNYSGAPLVFCGMNGAPDHRLFKTAYQHEVGYAVLHLGRHRHGAEDITSGERMNLVVWSYSHNFRSSPASRKRTEKEARHPDKRCVSYTHDRDFGHFREWPEGKKDQHLGRGWCPPRGKEYDGFVPDVSDANLPRRQQQQS